VRRKLSLDLEYIHTRTVWLDVRIVACTALRMFNVRGPAARRLLRLHRLPVVLKPEESTAETQTALVTSAAPSEAANHEAAEAVRLPMEYGSPAIARSTVAVS
jgi:hypothetical protein